MVQQNEFEYENKKGWIYSDQLSVMNFALG